MRVIYSTSCYTIFQSSLQRPHFLLTFHAFPTSLQHGVTPRGTQIAPSLVSVTPSVEAQCKLLKTSHTSYNASWHILSLLPSLGLLRLSTSLNTAPEQHLHTLPYSHPLSLSNPSSGRFIHRLRPSRLPSLASPSNVVHHGLLRE